LYGSAASIAAPPIMMIDSNQPQFILPEQQTPQPQLNQPDEVIFSRAFIFKFLYIKQIKSKYSINLFSVSSSCVRSKKSIFQPTKK
jgi:hypothetical protein